MPTSSHSYCYYHWVWCIMSPFHFIKRSVRQGLRVVTHQPCQCIVEPQYGRKLCRLCSLSDATLALSSLNIQYSFLIRSRRSERKNLSGTWNTVLDTTLNDEVPQAAAAQQECWFGGKAPKNCERVLKSSGVTCWVQKRVQSEDLISIFLNNFQTFFLNQVLT